MVHWSIFDAKLCTVSPLCDLEKRFKNALYSVILHSEELKKPQLAKTNIIFNSKRSALLGKVIYDMQASGNNYPWNDERVRLKHIKHQTGLICSL